MGWFKNRLEEHNSGRLNVSKQKAADIKNGIERDRKEQRKLDKALYTTGVLEARKNRTENEQKAIKIDQRQVHIDNSKKIASDNNFQVNASKHNKENKN